MIVILETDNVNLGRQKANTNFETIQTHMDSRENPHGVTAVQAGGIAPCRLEHRLGSRAGSEHGSDPRHLRSSHQRNRSGVHQSAGGVHCQRTGI